MYFLYISYFQFPVQSKTIWYNVHVCTIGSRHGCIIFIFSCAVGVKMQIFRHKRKATKNIESTNAWIHRENCCSSYIKISPHDGVVQIQWAGPSEGHAPVAFNWLMLALVFSSRTTITLSLLDTLMSDSWVFRYCTLSTICTLWIGCSVLRQLVLFIQPSLDTPLLCSVMKRS